jgi:nucleoside-diphosphate-sugar epimerase
MAAILLSSCYLVVFGGVGSLGDIALGWVRTRVKVFVTGATGVMGRSVVGALLPAGHEVGGLARSDHKAAILSAMGVRPGTASLFDVPALTRVFDGYEAVVNLATHVPVGYTAMRPGAWRANDRIRSEGSKAVAEAATAAGVQTLVQESVSVIYSDGADEWLDETSPVCVTRATEPVAVAETNAQNFANTWRRTAVLRFGNLVGDDDFTRWRLARTSAGQPIGLGDPEGWAHVLHTDDVGSAVLAALTAKSGVYNVGAEPVRRGELADVFARAVGRERSGFVPKVVVRLAGERLEPLTRSQRVTSARLTEQTGWKPVHGFFGASWLVGVNMGFHERRRPA